MFQECITHALQALRGAGLTAAQDARNLALPGVWVTPDTASIEHLDDGAAVTLALVLVTSAAPDQAAAALDELLAAVTDALDTNPEWTAASIRLPNHASDPLPALRGTVTLTWRKP